MMPDAMYPLSPSRRALGELQLSTPKREVLVWNRNEGEKDIVRRHAEGIGHKTINR
jgi:hypothetical protein